MIVKEALLPIEEVAGKLGLSRDRLYPYGPHMAKVLGEPRDVLPRIHSGASLRMHASSSPFYSLLSPQGSEQVGKALQVRVLPPHLLQGGTPSARYPGSQP